MRLISFFKQLFTKHKTYSDSFSSTFSDAVKDTFKEMGYRFDDTNSKKNSGLDDHLFKAENEPYITSDIK